MTQGKAVATESDSFFSTLSDQIVRVLHRYEPPADGVLIGTALVVGLLTGVGAVIFRYLITAFAWIGYVWVPEVTSSLGKSYVLFVPAIGGLMVGLLVFYFAREAKGHGVPEVMEAVAIKGGRIRPQVAVVKSLASSICIGSGGSVGREGPIVQIGSALGSSIGQLLRLSDDRISNLVACGAAGGIAATFNAPIAAVIFALEVIMGGRFTVRYFSSVVVSAVAAAVVGRVTFGDAPAFKVPFEYGIKSLWEYPLYAVLGVLAALVGVAFVIALYWTEDRFDNWNGVREWVKPGIGGVMIGILALLYPLGMGTLRYVQTPQIYNVGYDIIEAALANNYVFAVAAALLVLKLLATSITLGSGGSGGVFAPALFMGAMLGAAFQTAAIHLFPSIVAPAGAYALVGMAAAFAASAHAPMTAVLILFELTGDYRIILPLMLAVGIATLISQKMLKGESIYTLKLTRRGVRLHRGRDEDVMESVTVGEIMSRNFSSVTDTTTLEELSKRFSDTHRHGFPVLNADGELAGIVSIGDLDAAMQNNMPPDTPVLQIGTPRSELLVVRPAENMGTALARMGTRGMGRLPVVDPADPNRLLGVVRRDDITRAYNIAISRRADLQYRAQRSAMRNIDGTVFSEVSLNRNSPAVGQRISELSPNFPKKCILVSIRRDGQLLIPHGDTVFQNEDLVTVFVNANDVAEIQKCLVGDQREPALEAA